MFGGIKTVQQVMWRLSSLLNRRLRGANFKSTVKGDGVATDNLATKSLREMKRKVSFPACGGSEYDNQERLGSH
jgi:hypothetical protein